MRMVFTLICLGGFIQSYGQKETSLKELLNHVVGGIWMSTNEKNTNTANDYSHFYMSFDNWNSDESVIGKIYGVSNAKDTSELIQIWNFIDRANGNIFLVQRTSWGAKSTGTIAPYEGKHMDIRFKTTTADGQTYFTRDIHYIESKNKMRAVTFHRAAEDEEWEETSTSHWIRNK